MVSQPVINVIIGAGLSGILLIINSLWITWNNNKSQQEREKQQHIWQEEREQQQRIWQEKSEQQKWYREKTYDSYRRAIEVLKKLIQLKLELERSNLTIEDKHDYFSPNLDNLRLDFSCEFDIIIMGHPSKDSEEFEEKISTITSQMKQNPSKARILVTEMMEYDPRIKDI